ncbi:glycoside hydrolase family 6 protein [Streptomyces sp. NRRL S-118]|uniref:glycoside hydrolase family 6 protein n=1 Tax=Streptomyces sp. NRRL S-118 TaxID=1463881 RepID=UPI0004C97530|nr:glycoside hydrolase family 6 protein [Streptomyces sp. NRRL S-118]
MYGSCTGRARAGALAVGAAWALLLTGCSSSDGTKESQGSPPVSQQPKNIDPFWVNPDTKAAQALASHLRKGDAKNAELIRKIASQPVGAWVGSENPEQEARGYTEAAAKADRDAVLVLYNIPHRDCGQHSAGGAADGNAYRDWLDKVAKGIGDRPATVILEPDAVMHMVDNCTDAQYHEERYDLLRGAVERLKQQPRTKVYLDAGNAGWGKPDQIHEPLQRAGIARADGFAVNVANFQTTEASKEYGKKVSAKAGGKPFVIDTSRNGNGPYTGGDPAENWCNPPGRALGETPTTDTGDPLVDAYLWIKRPGESDGDCKGGPKAGDWYPEYALELARNTK